MEIGDNAPDITLPNQEGEEVRLYDLLEDQALVLFFYPRDDSPVCTAEACAFRDAYEDFAEAGATVVGISGDDVQSHQKFASRHNLPFTLLSDHKGEARKAFDVPNTFFVLPGRVTYVIDQEGRIRHQFNSALNAEKHVEEALTIVQNLTEDGD